MLTCLHVLYMFRTGGTTLEHSTETSEDGNIFPAITVCPFRFLLCTENAHQTNFIYQICRTVNFLNQGYIHTLYIYVIVYIIHYIKYLMWCWIFFVNFRFLQRMWLQLHIRKKDKQILGGKWKNLFLQYEKILDKLRRCAPTKENLVEPNLSIN